MIILQLEELEEYTDGNIVHGERNIIINDFCLTKEMKGREKYFFIPIVFKKENRENYILEHVKKGCIGFMINKASILKQEIEKKAITLNPNICIIEVENVNDALFKLGKIWRQKNINKETIAVTGSVGKTTLCSLISKVLSTELKVLHDFKNQNNNTRSHISLSYLFFDYYDMAVTELGISDFDIMHNLSELVQPSIAVINSIASAHINNLKSKENILQEKLHIIDYLKDKKILFVNADDEYLKKIKKSDNYELRYYSLNEAKNIIETEKGINFTTKIYGKDTNFSLNLFGNYNIRNIILAIKIAEIYDIKYENIIKAINEFKSVDGRFKVWKNVEKSITVIDDTYNSCYESVINGLKIANKMESRRKIAVLGTIGSGINGKEDTDEIHEQLGKYFSNLNFDYLYLTGDYTKHIFKGARENSFKENNIKRFKTKELLKVDLEKNIEDGDLIFFKEAGLQGFEELVNELKERYSLKNY